MKRTHKPNVKLHKNLAKKIVLKKCCKDPHKLIKKISKLITLSTKKFIGESLDDITLYEIGETVKNMLQFIPNIKVTNVRKDPLNKDAMIATISIPERKRCLKKQLK